MRTEIKGGLVVPGQSMSVISDEPMVYMSLADYTRELTKARASGPDTGYVAQIESLVKTFSNTPVGIGTNGQDQYRHFLMDLMDLIATKDQIR